MEIDHNGVVLDGEPHHLRRNAPRVNHEGSMSKKKEDAFREQLQRSIKNADHIAHSDMFGVGIHSDASDAADKAETLRYVLRVFDKHFPKR